MKRKIASIRKDYTKKKLSEKMALPTPFKQFTKWWKQALKSGITEVNAMTLATASSDGMPSARIVLLKDYNEKGFVFFTNYDSFKGRQLAENPKACLVFSGKNWRGRSALPALLKR
jgi:pyridoxamine 5'-phosphate oxidase